MGTLEEEWEYKKGFERGFEGKSKSEAAHEIVFGFVQKMFGFEKEESQARREGYKAGSSERLRRKYYAGETAFGKFGFDERNVDRSSGFAANDRERK